VARPEGVRVGLWVGRRASFPLGLHFRLERQHGRQERLPELAREHEVRESAEVHEHIGHTGNEREPLRPTTAPQLVEGATVPGHASLAIV